MVLLPSGRQDQVISRPSGSHRQRTFNFIIVKPFRILVFREFPGLLTRKNRHMKLRNCLAAVDFPICSAFCLHGHFPFRLSHDFQRFISGPRHKSAREIQTTSHRFACQFRDCREMAAADVFPAPDAAGPAYDGSDRFSEFPAVLQMP